jgi:hypothetical protein
MQATRRRPINCCRWFMRNCASSPCTVHFEAEVDRQTDVGKLVLQLQVVRASPGNVFSFVEGRSGSASRMIRRIASMPPRIISFPSNGVWPTSNS